jgi:predicted NAD/FAD-binding protein
VKIAIIGSGIAGLVAARRLSAEHEITVFEADDYVGGHTHTVDVEEGDRRIPVDTGFIIFSERNYPLFSQLLREIGVRSQPTDMSFSVRDERNGLEYRGSSFNTLFAQRRNIFRPSFHRMFWDIVRFNREAPRAIHEGHAESTLGEYLREAGYSRLFVENHIVPMASALWSADPARIDGFPLEYFVRFFQNHGLLGFRDRPQWRVIQGGSREYVGPLTEPFRDRIRLSTPVAAVRRNPNGVEVFPRHGQSMSFDRVVLAVHSDQALRMLTDPSEDERRILGAIPYQPNDVVLHTDTRLMPRRRRAWSSWNYHVTRDQGPLATVTYWMNKLQGLQSQEQYFVTLNRTRDIDPGRILRRFVYWHPVYEKATVAAQKEYPLINGVRNTHYCGAYWGYGFHEDGVRSAFQATDMLVGVPA